MHNPLLLSESLIWQLPGFVVVKDCDSNYLVSNQRATELLGYSSLDSIAGITDYDAKCDAARFAEQFIIEDQLAVNTNKSVSLLYFLKYADEKVYCLLSQKKLLTNPNTKQSMGIYCHSTFLNNAILNSINKNIFDQDNRFLRNNDAHLGGYYLDEYPHPEIMLSKSQAWCLFYLLRGKTCKEIGKILMLSPRTVEKYVESIKEKFECSTKSQLIEKAIDMGYFYSLPLDSKYLMSK